MNEDNFGDLEEEYLEDEEDNNNQKQSKNRNQNQNISPINKEKDNNTNRNASSFCGSNDGQDDEGEYLMNDYSMNSDEEGKMSEQKRESYFFDMLDKRQIDRYEKYKSASIEHRKNNKSTQKLECPRVKKIVQNILGEGVNISDRVQMILHGVAKLYAGELVEEAKSILVDEKERQNNKKNFEKNINKDDVIIDNIIDKDKQKNDDNKDLNNGNLDDNGVNNINNKSRNGDFSGLGKKRNYSPIKPRHLREARRRMIRRGILPIILNKNNSIFKKKKIV